MGHKRQSSSQFGTTSLLKIKPESVSGPSGVGIVTQLLSNSEV